MKRRTKIKCPYCGTLVTILVTNDWSEHQIVTCEPEAGGCDLIFLVKTEVELKFTTYLVAEVSNARTD